VDRRGRPERDERDRHGDPDRNRGQRRDHQGRFNDAIIKVDFINQKRAEGDSKRDAILEAGRLRLRPILMTTVTTVLGLLPLAAGWGAGADLRAPLAVAVIGGLISATVLTLIVVPVVYSLVVSPRESVSSAAAFEASRAQ
jgi:Cu/Ag efflux pump CusA